MKLFSTTVLFIYQIHIEKNMISTGMPNGKKHKSLLETAKSYLDAEPSFTWRLLAGCSHFWNKWLTLFARNQHEDSRIAVILCINYKLKFEFDSGQMICIYLTHIPIAEN